MIGLRQLKKGKGINVMGVGENATDKTSQSTNTLRQTGWSRTYEKGNIRVTCDSIGNVRISSFSINNCKLLQTWEDELQELVVALAIAKGVYDAVQGENKAGNEGTGQ